VIKFAVLSVIVLLPITIMSTEARASGIRLWASASAGASNVINEAGYNSPFDVYTAGTGFLHHVIVNPGCGSDCSFSNTGLSDTSGTTTTGSESSTGSSTFINGTATGNAYAAASLDAAWVKVSSGGNYLDSFPNPNSGQNGGSGEGWGQFNDVLHFNIAGASANTVSYVGVSYTVDGTISPGGVGDANGSIDNLFQFGTGVMDDIVHSGPNTYTPFIYSTNVNQGWASSGFSTNTPGLMVFNATYALVGPEADVYVAGTLDVACGLGTTCDYSHTAQFALTSLPGNVTFTSDSGVFLTAPLSGVPEPSSVLFLTAALFGLVIVERKRRAATR
jgi:hypothetical protein